MAVLIYAYAFKVVNLFVHPMAKLFRDLRSLEMRFSLTSGGAKTAGQITLCWGQSLGYDRYANLPTIPIPTSHAQCTVPTLNPSISQTTNRITNPGFTYDSAGKNRS